MFMRRPVMYSNRSSTSSRSRKPKSIGVVAPSSRPKVAMATRWEEMRLSSIIMTRMVCARSGTRSVMPRSCSTAMQYAASLKMGDR